MAAQGANASTATVAGSPVHRLLDGRSVVARVAADLIVLLVATAIAGTEGLSSSGRQAVFLFPLVAVAVLAARGSYANSDLSASLLDDAVRAVVGTGLGAILVIALATELSPGEALNDNLLWSWAVGAVGLVGFRSTSVFAQRRARRRGLASRRTVIVGAGDVGAQLERRLLDKPDLGLRPVGFIDPDPPDLERSAPVLGEPADLERIVETVQAEHVILAFVAVPDPALARLVARCEELGVEVSLVPRLFERTNKHVRLDHIGGLPIYQFRSMDPKSWQFVIKHALDTAFAAVLLLLLSPLLVGTAIAVKLSSPGPVFFRQPRIGRDGAEFEMLKFRSMAGDYMPDPPLPDLLPPDTAPDLAPGGVEGGDRRTRVGTFLRRSSLDELAQLFNVLKGDMSLVGPRPERPEYVQFFGQNVHRYTDRHRVKSGITGWAQIHGLRGKTSISDRVEWDNYYISNWSLWLDFKILLLTAAAPLRRAE